MKTPLPLSIFDYDKNRNYRFIIAQDKSLLMYDGKGKSVNGFKLKKVEAQILSSPKHLRFQGQGLYSNPINE